MGKKYQFMLEIALSTVLFASAIAKAEDIYLDCTRPEAQQNQQCAALYKTQAFLPTGNNAQIVQPNNINVNNPNAPINAVPGADYTVPGLGYQVPQQQVVMRDTAAPIAVSQPMDDMTELGSEYGVYKTHSGSLVYERDVTQEQLDDGATLQTARTRETTISPSYVEMPSISAHKRSNNKAYGDSVHDWEAVNGDSLRALLIEWGQKSGWTVVWKLDRDYILEAGVVFRGTFTDVASAIIRTFARAVPAPIGTFYKGNRVLVINTQEDDNG